MKNKYYDENIIIDFEIPYYLQESIDNLLKERKKKDSLKVDLFVDEFISECNSAYYDGKINHDQRAKLRDKYL